MIKFNFLIHKETGTVIQYKEWYESTRDYLRIGEKRFNPRDVLFSDDFQIIYDSEFTTEELTVINDGLESFKDEYIGTGLRKKEIEIAYNLATKISELTGEREYVENKYKIHGK